MMHPCPRTLDKPILLFGLEIEDVGILSLVVGLGSLTIGPVIPGIIAVIAWVTLIFFKRDKPQGYLLHCLYHQGFELPGLIYPIKKIQVYSVSHD